MATPKQWLVQGIENETIFFDAEFDGESEARERAKQVKSERPYAIVAIYELREEL